METNAETGPIVFEYAQIKKHITRLERPLHEFQELMNELHHHLKNITASDFAPATKTIDWEAFSKDADEIQNRPKDQKPMEASLLDAGLADMLPNLR